VDEWEEREGGLAGKPTRNEVAHRLSAAACEERDRMEQALDHLFSKVTRAQEALEQDSRVEARPIFSPMMQAAYEAWLKGSGESSR
jgi:hypothetical protein